ncbi:hypothetical protein BDZ97DRAFT_1357817 [Flammula alnicola]|nr:hypothetical protein BDZ97DRAFT_1357817 [Flammula alnicola]
MLHPAEVETLPTSEILNLDEVTPFSETVARYSSYSEASVAACTWVDNGKVTGRPQVDPKDLVLLRAK